MYHINTKLFNLAIMIIYFISITINIVQTSTH